MAAVHLNYRFGSFQIDVARRQLTCDGEPVTVQARVFDLLAYLAAHNDRVVDKDELLDEVWPGRVITETAMTRAIMKARVAVGDDANQPTIIQTVYGKGYRFVAPVEVIEEGPGPQRATAPARSPKVFAVTAILALLVAAFAGQYWLLQETGDEGAAVSSAPADNSIAVLPFVNMSDDAANEYFSDGLSEELMNLLARIRELRVVSRASSFSVKGKDATAAEIAAELRVAYLLEGSVRKAGDRVRVTAQLIDARSDTHLWSQTYDRSLDDIFAIQDDIAGAVVAALKLTLLADAPRAPAVDPEAFALFLQARYLNGQGTADAFAQSVELYQRALELDPGFARAWRGLAVNYVNQANKGLRAKGESYNLARDAVNRALAIDPDYARAHALLGVFAMTLDQDLAAAAPHFRYALSLQPTDPVLLSYASSFLLRLGRLDEVIAIREVDVANDPLDPIGYNNLAWVYAMDGRADDAIDAVKTLLMLAPKYNGAHITWGKALLLKGEPEQALEVILLEPSEVWRLFGLTIVYHSLGRPVDSDAALGKLIEGYANDWAYYIALAAAWRGEADRAFEWLETAVQNRDASLTYVGIEPLFSGIHGDPRWRPFLDRIGMSPEYLDAIEFRVSLPER